MNRVLIVGAGPIGSHLAGLLAQKGIEVTILEEHKTVGEPVHCTGIVGHHAFEEFDLNRDAILNTIHSISMLSPSGERITYNSETPLAYAVCRASYDQYLTNKAVQSGAKLKLGVRVNSLEQEEDGVTIYCSTGEILRGKICVLATGSLCNLPFRLGLGRPKKFMLGAQIEGKITPLDHTEVYVNRDFAPGFFAWAVPLGKDNMARLGLCAPDNSSQYFKGFLNWLQREKHLDLQGRQPAFSRIPVGLCKRSYFNRVVALGDAASQVKPTTGGGLYYGLKCGQILAEFLSPQVMESKWHLHHFKNYEKKWKKLLSRELRAGYLFRELVARTDNRKLDRIIREMKREHFYKQIFSQAHFDYHGRMILKIFSQPLLAGLFLSSFKDFLVSKIFPQRNKSNNGLTKEGKGL